MMARPRFLLISIVCVVLAMVLLSAVRCAAEERSVSVTTMRYALLTATTADAVTTAAALSAGRATEGNPLMRPLADNPLALTAVKVGAFVVTDVLLSKLAKRNKKAALVTGWLLTSMYTTVAIRNARIHRRAQ
jgi:hypothetical protein